MRYFLRLATKSAWTGAANPTHEQRERAKNNFRLREDERGLSVWEFNDEEELKLVLAAISCQRQRSGHIDYLEVDEVTIHGLGQVASTVGQTPVTKANSLHRELCWSQQQLDALADTLIANGKVATRAKRSDVRGFVSALDDGDVDDSLRDWLATQREKHAEQEAKKKR
ncbi:MAG: hypothetical protein AAF715_18615 [Myxococcota bacterium]